MAKWEGLGPQCEKCKGTAHEAVVCDGCDYLEDDCVCDKEVE